MLGLLRCATARHMIAIGGDDLQGTGEAEVLDDAPDRRLGARDDPHQVRRTQATEHLDELDDALLAFPVGPELELVS